MMNDIKVNNLAAAYDVVIIGSGPAGLATAIALKKLGIDNIIVLERAEEAGGNPRHCGHSPFGMREFKRVYLGPAYAQKIVTTAQSHQVDIALNTSVTALGVSGLLTLSTPQGKQQIQAKRVVIATGTRETPRAPRFVSGQRPQGIVTTGALQSMVYLSRKKPFKHPVIVGTELVSFSAIATCRHAGIKPVAMLEKNNRITAYSPLSIYPKLLGIDVRLGSQIESIEGMQQVTGVNIKDAHGKQTSIACDGVIFSGQFTPEASLARMGHLAIDPRTQGPVIDQYGRCSDPAYFVAGNGLRPVETGGWCWQEGEQLASYVASSLAQKLPDVSRQVGFDIQSSAIKYLVPQKLSLPSSGDTPAGMQSLQCRVTTKVKGELSIQQDGKKILSRQIHALPERRLLLAMPALQHLSENAVYTVHFKPQ